MAIFLFAVKTARPAMQDEGVSLAKVTEDGE